MVAPSQPQGVDTVEAGQMTKDLAILIGPKQAYLSTNKFIEAIDTNLRKALGG